MSDEAKKKEQKPVDRELSESVKRPYQDQREKFDRHAHKDRSGGGEEAAPPTKNNK